MNGNFWGGMFQGGLAVDKQLNDDAQTQMAREKADRDQYQFNKQQQLDTSLQNISDQEQAAQDNSQQEQNYVNSGAATDALMQQAKNANPDLTDDELAAARPYYSPNGSNSDFLLKEGALATARNNTVDDGADINDALSPEQTQAIGAAYGGITPDPVNAYRFSLDRAKAYQTAGDWQSANALQTEAESKAAGNYIDAILNRDPNRVYQLYNAYPNGHNLRTVDFDNAGNIVTEDENGYRAVTPQYDAIAAALGKVKPEVAVNMAMSKLRDQDANARLLESLDARAKWASERQDQQLALGLTRISAMLAKRGFGSGGAGSGKGYNQDGTISLDDFSKTFLDDSGKVSPQTATAYSAYLDLVQQQPRFAANTAGHWELANIAQQYARGQLFMNPELQPDGSWANQITDKNGLKFTFQSNIQPNGVLDGTGKPIVTPDKALAQLKTSFPQEYSQASQVLAAPNGLTMLQQAASKAAPGSQDKLQATRMLNIASQLKQFQPATPAPSAGTTGGASAGQSQVPSFTADDIARMGQLGIKPNKPLSAYVTDPYNAAVDTLSDKMLQADQQQFNYDLQQLRSGSDNRWAAKRLQDAINTNPAFANQLTPDDRLKIKAYNPQ